MAKNQYIACREPGALPYATVIKGKDEPIGGYHVCPKCNAEAATGEISTSIIGGKHYAVNTYRCTECKEVTQLKTLIPEAEVKDVEETIRLDKVLRGRGNISDIRKKKNTLIKQAEVVKRKAGRPKVDKLPLIDTLKKLIGNAKYSDIIQLDNKVLDAFKTIMEN